MITRCSASQGQVSRFKVLQLNEIPGGDMLKLGYNQIPWQGYVKASAPEDDLEGPIRSSRVRLQVRRYSFS